MVLRRSKFALLDSRLIDKVADARTQLQISWTDRHRRLDFGWARCSRPGGIWMCTLRRAFIIKKPHRFVAPLASKQTKFARGSAQPASPIFASLRLFVHHPPSPSLPTVVCRPPEPYTCSRNSLSIHCRDFLAWEDAWTRHPPSIMLKSLVNFSSLWTVITKV